MIEIYKECICTVWKWTKQFMLGLAVLLPGIIFLIYMFVANMPDVGLVPGILVIAAISQVAMCVPESLQDSANLGIGVKQ